mmetsp:Transcript_190/g.218  ORF Transcript_190/g.218 Transcript_190/m.218 type:complete len:103 (+) Transcript_190:358-666(+)
MTSFADPGMELPVLPLRTFNNIGLNIDKWTHMSLELRNKVNRSSDNFNTLCCIFPLVLTFVTAMPSRSFFGTDTFASVVSTVDLGVGEEVDGILFQINHDFS